MSQITSDGSAVTGTPSTHSLIDEFHQCKALEVLAVLPRFHLGGVRYDRQQRSRQMYHSSSVSGRQQADQEPSALAWIEKCHGCWKFDLQETYRLGVTLVTLLQQLFPDDLSRLTSISPEDTLVLLTLFNKTTDFYYPFSGEVSASQS